MKSRVIIFPYPKEPNDDVLICYVEINGRGDVDLIINAGLVGNVEQHNWLIAKLGEAVSRLIERKKLT